MSPLPDVETRMWRKYERIIGKQAEPYLSDVLHILMGEEVIDLLEAVIDDVRSARQREDERKEAANGSNR